MEIKLFEIRDKATMMPVMAIALFSRDAAEAFLLERAGFAATQTRPPLPDGFEPYVILVKLDGVEAQYDPFAWATRARTISNAHRQIIDSWQDLTSGDVIDVEFLLGETSEPKVSERVDR